MNLNILGKMEKYRKCISSSDSFAISKLKLKLGEIQIRRNEIKEFNVIARKTNKKPYSPADLENLRGLTTYYKKRIKVLEKNRDKENKLSLINNVKVIENLKEEFLELYFNDPPFYETIVLLKENGFIWNLDKLCWYKKLEKDNLTYLKIIS